MGTRIGATKLPTFKGIKADETTYDIQMGAFAGSKLMGVKSSTKFPAYALSFASFLTSEEGQRVRYEAIKRLPTNKVLAASDLTDGNVAADGLQAQAPFAISQRSSVGGKFWDPSQANGNYIKDATTRELTPQEQLDAFIDAINNI
jgi:arabinogalactan oligomer/maltooligosaccharide transport system substrate-binding protein